MVKINGKQVAGCIYCENHNEFILPKDVIEAALNNDLILFCGAGISTETRKVMPHSFYTEIKNKLEESNIKVDNDISFSKMMSLYCANFRNGRQKLYQLLQNRFQMVKNFLELYNSATEFHKEVTQIPQINTVITTNWDTYFEDECDMFPIIYNEDAALWDTFEKRVFKVHGSIKNVGSIVATEEDYQKCYKRLSEDPIGDRLKTILSTKTVVFIGFSFGDEDLNNLLDVLSGKLGDFSNQYYLVTIDRNWEKNKDKRIIPIITDGTFFIQSLKEELITRGVLVKNDIYDHAKDCNHILIDEHMDLTNHENFSDILIKYPELLLTVAYQDGLIHAYQRCIANKTNGSFLRHGYVNDVARQYNTFYKKRLRERNYNLAYYDLGYSDGMISLCLLSEGQAEAYCPPPYIYKDEQFANWEQLMEYLDKNRDNEVFEYCRKMVSNFPDGTIPHNRPWFC
ncbi:SIR2 family protein [Streptococcus mutans]|nr:SIR2 family protein [Streptococcus mutans]